MTGDSQLDGLMKRAENKHFSKGNAVIILPTQPDGPSCGPVPTLRF